MGQRKTVLNIPASAAFTVTASGDTVTNAQALATALATPFAPDGQPFSNGLSVDAQETLLILFNVTTITATSIQFLIDTLGDDGVWYPLTTAVSLTAAGQKYIFTLAGQNSQSNEFGVKCRLRWVVNGAGSVTFSGTIFGK